MPYTLVAPAPRWRRRLARGIALAAVLVIIFGSGLAAPHIVPSIVRMVGSAIFPVTNATVPNLAAAEPEATVTAPQAGTSLGMGATQSYNGLAVTVSDLRVQLTNGPVGAPSGSEFAIVRVRILNVDPGQVAPYNAGDFVLVDSTGHAQRQTFAALTDPLGVGIVAAGGDVTGELAFLVTAKPHSDISSLVIVWLPSVSAGTIPLSWSLQLDTSAPPGLP